VVDSAFLTLLTESDAGSRGDAERARTILTPRELEILELLASGTSDGEIAHLLGVAATTIQTHVGNILRKAGVTTRVQLGVFAHASQVVEFPDQPPSLVAI
jgi:DNA-binding NarL/FixJ family response regulator